MTGEEALFTHRRLVSIALALPLAMIVVIPIYSARREWTLKTTVHGRRCLDPVECAGERMAG